MLMAYASSFIVCHIVILTKAAESGNLPVCVILLYRQLHAVTKIKQKCYNNFVNKIKERQYAIHT